MRVTGVGGIFFQAQDPEKLYRWYERHLGMKRGASGTPVCFFWRQVRGRGKGMTV